MESLTKKIRVLHLITTMPVGGAESLILTTMRNLDARRFSSVLCCIKTKGMLGDEVEKAGFPVIALDGMIGKRFDRNIVRKIQAVIEKENIDIVHCHLYHAAFYGRLAAKRCKKPSVVTIHNVYSNPKLHRRLINHWLSRHTAALVAVSGAVAQHVVRYDRVEPLRLNVVPNGIDVATAKSQLTKTQARAMLNIPANAMALVTIGRLEKQKGHLLLLKALRLLRDHSGDCPHLLLVGDGSERGNLLTACESLALGDRVHLLGTRRDIADILRAADIFVLPSFWEGLPLSMLEAMAAGLPVIATKVGGIGEVLGENEFGVLLPPDDVPALATAITDLVENHEKRVDLAKKGISRVNEKYSVGGMLKVLESIYAKVHMRA